MSVYIGVARQNEHHGSYRGRQAKDGYQEHALQEGVQKDLVLAL